ncbi:MAG TPA: rRNA maturation RNase YbeY [bacterium]|nr:rRNA maturation RNase YbeY [bacterium]
MEVLGRCPGHGAPAAAMAGLLGAYLAALALPRAEVALKLTGLEGIRRLNAGFRALDRATDVLSFPALEGKPAAGFAGHLGDLAYCPAYAWSKRGRFHRDFGAESAFLLLHGVLHLCGQHHDSPAEERRMWGLARALHPLGRPYFGRLRALSPLGAPS